MNAAVMKTWPRITLKNPRYLRAKARIVAMAQEILRQHREEPVPGRAPDLIDDILAATTEDGKPLDELSRIAATIGPMIAGIDTAANTTSFMLYALLTNPELYKRVEAEVDAAFANGVPALQDYQHMTALHGAALETLRMYPVAFAVPRTAVAPFEYGGYHFEPGQEIYVASGVPHYLPEFYPEPYRFDVNRYAAPRNEHRKAGVFAPYGLGAHTCLGAAVAEIQIMVTVATIMRTTWLTLDPPDYECGRNENLAAYHAETSTLSPGESAHRRDGARNFAAAS